MSLGASEGGLLLGTTKPCREFEGLTGVLFFIREGDLYRLGCIVLNEGLLGLRFEPMFKPKLGLAENSLLLDASCELPNIDEGGGPAGVKEPAEEGGGPAGVVVGLEAMFSKGLPWLLLRDR